MQDNNSPEKPSNWFFRFYRHPVINAAGLICSVISVPLATYFYVASIQKPELSVYVSPVRAAVVNGDGISKLKVFIGDKEIPGKITAAQVAIWNNGSSPIRPENVLKEVLLQTSSNSPILEASIRKTTRDVVGLSLDQSRLAEGIVGISWNILEKNDGGVIQLVYSGSQDAEIRSSGVIVGQPRIRQVTYSGKIMTPTDQLRSQITSGWFLLTIVGISLALYVTVVFRMKEIEALKKRNRNMWIAYRAFLFLSPVFFIGAIAIAAVNLYSPSVPFSF